MNKIMSFLKVFFLCLIVSQFTVLLADDKSAEQTVTQGKIVIIVLDVSGSIKPYFKTIQDVLTKTIVKERLDKNDYFALIPFGDDAKMMYSGQITRSDDNESIINTLYAMKANNKYTDMGTALKTTLEQIVKLKEQRYDMFEPLVIFLTDGNHAPGSKSAFAGKAITDMFSDPLIGNKELYGGWYIIGVGKDLSDLKTFAELSGRSEFLLSIEDLSKLEVILDQWISNIPPSQPIEKGEVLFSNLTISGHKLKPDKLSLALTGATELEFNLVSTYKRTPVKYEIISGKAQFQSDDMTQVVPVTLSMESGVISLAPLDVRKSKSSFSSQSPLQGKGILKITVKGKLNQIERETDLEYKVEFLSKKGMFVRKWLVPIIAVLLIILVFVVHNILKDYAPVSISIDIVGKPTRSRPVKLAIRGRGMAFGNGPSSKMKLDEAGSFNGIVGTLERIGKNTYKITPRDKNSFLEPDSLDNYKLNSIVKMKTRDGNPVSIRFKKDKRRRKR